MPKFALVTSIRAMIDQETVERLGLALAELHQRYPARDIRKILDYAYNHRRMDGYPHDLAQVLEEFALKLRSLPQQPDPLEHWQNR